MAEHLRSQEDTLASMCPRNPVQAQMTALEEVARLGSRPAPVWARVGSSAYPQVRLKLSKLAVMFPFAFVAKTVVS
jgi:hypothetical protein